MRSKNPELMRKIREFVDQYYRENRTAPSTHTVGDAMEKCGFVPTGETEEEQVEEYVSLPESIFGKGKFYLVRAKGDSMIDAGIEEGDLVLVELCNEANEGDIVVALDPEGENTLKRYAGKDRDGYLLAYMNEACYPGKVMKVKSFVVQGVARHVIKTL